MLFNGILAFLQSRLHGPEKLINHYNGTSCIFFGINMQCDICLYYIFYIYYNITLTKLQEVILSSKPLNMRLIVLVKLKTGWGGWIRTNDHGIKTRCLTAWLRPIMTCLIIERAFYLFTFGKAIRYYVIS